MTGRRAVVTGFGVLSPVAIGADANWEGLVAGRSGIADITAFDTSDYEIHVAGEVKGFDATQHMDAQVTCAATIAIRTSPWPQPGRPCAMRAC